MPLTKEKARFGGDPRPFFIRQSDKLARKRQVGQFNRVLPGQGRPVQPDDEDFSGQFQKMRDERIGQMQENGQIAPDLAVKTLGMPAPRNPEELESQIGDIKSEERGRTRWAFNLIAPEHVKIRQRLAANAEDFEGYAPRAGDTVGDGKQTIGIGFNMTDNASKDGVGRRWLEDVAGYDWDKLFSGQDVLEHSDAVTLYNVVMADKARRMAELFTPEERSRIPMHMWEGLMDLAYQSDPSSMKDWEMTKAIQRGDIARAVEEIATNTLGGEVNTRNAGGVLARRYWQAAKVGGVPLNHLTAHYDVPQFRTQLRNKFPRARPQGAERKLGIDQMMVPPPPERKPER